MLCLLTTSQTVSTLLPDHSNNIFISNFNLQVSENQDTDSAIFNDSIEDMGLHQHVHFQMHKSGNVLDLLPSDITQSTGILTMALGPYLSDHRAVIATLNTRKLQHRSEVRHIRKLHQVIANEWNQVLNPDNFTLSNNLEDMVKGLNKELVRVQDEHAHEKMHSFT